MLALAVTITGCGTQPTGHGAPPYDDSADSTTGQTLKIRTRYPELGLTFTLPPMSGSDQLPVAAFVRYQVLVTRALRSNDVPPQLRHVASKAIRAQIARWIADDEKYGLTQTGDIHVDIRTVNTSTYSTLTLCYRDTRTFRTSSGLRDQPDEARPLAVLVGHRTSGNWAVSAIGDSKTKMRNC